MVRLKKLGSGGHTEAEIPVPLAIEEILKHLTKGGLAITERGEKISAESVKRIKESDKIILIPKISGG